MPPKPGGRKAHAYSDNSVQQTQYGLSPGAVSVDAGTWPADKRHNDGAYAN